jgi:hypothetical protein
MFNFCHGILATHRYDSAHSVDDIYLEIFKLPELNIINILHAD